MADVGFDVEVVLRAEGSDPDGDSIGWRWRQDDGPTVSLRGDRTKTLRFRTQPRRPAAREEARFGPIVVPTNLTYEFVLTASDGEATTERRLLVRVASASPGWPRVSMGHALELSCGREGADARWELASQPPASKGRIENAERCNARLRPGRRGRYVVREAGRELVVYAGGWTGVRECSRSDCHASEGRTFPTTSHATAFDRSLADPDEPRFDERLTLGFDAFADDGGFDDVARRLGWNEGEPIPEALHDLANIQCEHCHAPGKFWTGYDGDVCAQCHDAREGPGARQVEAWRQSAMSRRPLPEQTQAACAPCHVAYAAVARLDGREANAPTEEDPATGVTCAVCHDPHDGRHAKQLRRFGDARVGARTIAAGAGAVCFECHGQGEPWKWRESARQGNAAHAPQGWMTASGPHANVEDGCVGCHMRGGNGMTLGGHSFAIRSAEARNLGPCRPCHADAARDLDRVQQEIDTGIETLRAGIADALATAGVRSCQGVLASSVVHDRGRIAPADARGSPLTACDGPIALPPRIAEAAAALLVVQGDRSRGAHAPAIAQGVLAAGRRALGLR